MILFKAKSSYCPYSDAVWQLSIQTNQNGLNKLQMFPGIKHNLKRKGICQIAHFLMPSGCDVFHPIYTAYANLVEV